MSTLGMAVAEVWTQHCPEPGAETETGAEQGGGTCFGKGSLQGTLGTRLSQNPQTSWDCCFRSAGGWGSLEMTQALFWDWTPGSVYL